ncbi:MAG: HAD family phosphatase [Propionibacteriaceae bacterium]|nr:HAD family phosphatase [Propionibacteriaceae bacterium]
MPADHRSVPAAVLWDFDGTLADSEPAWRAAERRLLAELGASVPEEWQIELLGLGIVQSAATMLGWAGREDLDAVATADRLGELALAELQAEGLRLRPGAGELLAALRSEGVACGLVSATYTTILTPMLASLPPNSFDVVVGGDEVAAGKPHPEPYLTAAARLGVAPLDCLVLEDSLTGIAAAQAAGMPTLGIPFGQELTDGPRRRVVATLAGLTVADVGALWRELAAA